MINSKYEIEGAELVDGMGEITVHYDEAGALQDEAYNSLLKFIRSLHNMRGLFREDANKKIQHQEAILPVFCLSQYFKNSPVAVLAWL